MNSAFSLRKATAADVPPLLEVERTCFTPERQSSRRVFLHALRSSQQQIWVGEAEYRIRGYATFWLFQHTLRVYSIAVLPSFQGKGLARALMHKAEALAQAAAMHRIVLEASARDKRLQDWYANLGYSISARLENYYAKGWHGLRLEKQL